MIRTLFMHQASGVGGGSYCLLNLVKNLDRTKIEPIVALKAHGPLEEELKKEGVEVVLFPQMAGIPYNLPLTPRNILNYWRVVHSENKLERLLKCYRIDVLYLNNMMIAPYLRPAKKTGCKTVMHVREHWPLNEHKKQLEWIRRIVYDNCDKLIAINHYSASIFPKKEATVIYDWINMSRRYKPMPMSEIFGEDMKGKKVLLYTGGTSYIKGVDYIIDTFTKDIVGSEYRLLMMGCESFLNAGLRHKVKSFLSKFGYHYLGKELQEKVNNDKRIQCMNAVYELKHIIEQSYCFISYFRIPHANLALAENIILGIPCIAADTEEAREYTNNGQYAKLVNPMNDRFAFSSQLKIFLTEIEQWKCMAEKGSVELSQIFDEKRNVKKLNDLLNNLFEQN
jgi:glycosyltransferase involved in cell wall biosynthesis